MVWAWALPTASGGGRSAWWRPRAPACSRIHQLGGGVSQALGTGGRDLSAEIGAVTARQGLELLSRDPETRVIVLISKPPAPQVAERLLAQAQEAGKPVVVDLIGCAPAARRRGNLHFVTTFDQAAELAVRLAAGEVTEPPGAPPDVRGFAAGQRYLRGLFSGGTLAYEALLLLQGYVPGIYANVPLAEEWRLSPATDSREHTIVDLGADEFTVGRLHPMMDNDLRLRRLRQEARDPEVAAILLDVVLGYGAHPDPAAELAPAIAEVQAQSRTAGRRLEVVAVVVGTDEDPQDMASQVTRLQEAGAQVKTSNEAAVRYVGRLVQALSPAEQPPLPQPVDLAALHEPLAAINVGLESFAASLKAQGAAVIQVDWRPPAGGDERLMAILERMGG